MQIFYKATECMLLSILWVVTSLPVITIGASTTALYYAVVKVIRNNEGYGWGEFWNGFRTNFKQATIIWLVALLFLELHPNDILAFRREVGLRTGVAVRHEIADDEQSGIAVLVVGKKLTGGRSEQVLLPEKELDELALRDFQFLRRLSDIGAVIRIDEGVVVYRRPVRGCTRCPAGAEDTDAVACRG